MSQQLAAVLHGATYDLRTSCLVQATACSGTKPYRWGRDSGSPTLANTMTSFRWLRQLAHQYTGAPETVNSLKHAICSTSSHVARGREVLRWCR